MGIWRLKGIKKLDSKKKGNERDEDRNNSDETQNEMQNSGM
jgi:hypothetical protein